MELKDVKSQTNHIFIVYLCIQNKMMNELKIHINPRMRQRRNKLNPPTHKYCINRYSDIFFWINGGERRRRSERGEGEEEGGERRRIYEIRGWAGKKLRQFFAASSEQKVRRSIYLSPFSYAFSMRVFDELKCFFQVFMLHKNSCIHINSH